MLPILNQSLWRDEAFTALLSQKSIPEIIGLTMKDTTPPLHYIFLHYWTIIFGGSEVSLRSLSFLFHILTVFFVYLICRKLIKSKVVNIIIAATVLLNPFLLQYSFEARAYSMLAFLSILAVYLTISRRFGFAGLALALAVLTHNYAVFVFMSFIVWMALIYKNKWKENAVLFGKLFIPPLISLVLWGLVIYEQWVQVAHGFWIKQSTFSMFLNSFELYSRGQINYPVQPMLFTFTLLLCFFAFGYWLWKDRREERGNDLLLLSMVVAVPTLLSYVISALFMPIYDERYLIFTDPLLIILAGYSVYRLVEVNRKTRNIILAVTAIYLSLLLQASEQVVSLTTKPAINYAVDQILSKAEQGDVIIPEGNLNFLEAKWYVKQRGKNIRVLAYSLDKKIPFYIGAVLFEPQEIIDKMPSDVKIWQITSDGGYKVIQEKN